MGLGWTYKHVSDVYAEMMQVSVQLQKIIQQVLTLAMDSGGYNINYFTVTSGATALPPNFGPNVLIFDPTMSMSSIQSSVDNIWNQQSSNQFASMSLGMKTGQVGGNGISGR